MDDAGAPGAAPGPVEGLERERRKLVATARSALWRGTWPPGSPELIYERLSLFGTAGIDVAAATGARHVLEINALLTAEESAWRGLHLVALARRAGSGGARLQPTCGSRSATRCGAIAPYAAGGPSITVPNGVDTESVRHPTRPERARAAFGLPPDGDVLGFTGSLRPWHGLDVAIAALAELPRAGAGWSSPATDRSGNNWNSRPPRSASAIASDGWERLRTNGFRRCWRPAIWPSRRIRSCRISASRRSSCTSTWRRACPSSPATSGRSGARSRTAAGDAWSRRVTRRRWPRR